ncbi:DUF2125 domain-containing protein [Tabrizicola sp. BL-A-41-H6]|uniref:DUF2125 domain-containing protein n=1 Tax=Tabrizicola sp. BL-A-41-H6 TaxID=3421107 RepID=UPI003D672E81
MFRMTTYLTAPALVMLMGGTAQAALTADQVWQSWKNAGALAGLTVSAATENSDGGVLTLNGVKIAPEGSAGLAISDMVLTEQSDGSVLIKPGADIGADLTGEGTAGSVKLTHDGLTMTAREGEAGALLYDYAAASLNVAFNSSYPATSFDGTDAGEATSKGTVGFTDVAGSYSDTPGVNRAFGFDLAASKIAYDINSGDPGLKMTTASISETADLAMSADVTLPSTVSLLAIAAPSDFGKALQEGMAVAVTTKQGASTGTASQDDQIFPYQMTFTAGPGEATGEFNKDRFSVRSTGEGLAIDLTSSAVPAPVKISTGPVEFGMTSPVMAAETAGDYGLTVKLNGVEVNEETWALVDPGAALKRDPADLSIDVAGKAKVDFIALMAAEEAGMTEVTPPAPETLDIRDLTLKIAGAAFTGVGAFTFDNSMGVPMPIGEANVTLTGGNALIDGLIATGLMTDDDAMGVRMMMGGFMSPGANPDELTSKIEAKAGGEITVNGQRVQ